jgi:hypothetical protein
MALRCSPCLFVFADVGRKRNEEFVMAQVGNSENSFGGEYMIQDHDHLSEVSKSTGSAQRGNARQAEQSQSGDRQQGSVDQNASTQHGGERQRKSR